MCSTRTLPRRRLLRWTVTTVVLGVVAYFFGTGLRRNWSAVQEIDFHVDGWSVVAVVLFAVAVVVSGLLWGDMVSRLGAVRVTRLEAVRVQCASWLLKYIPGQVGSVTNKIVWAGDRGISRSLAVLSFVYENVFLLIGSIVPTGIILLLWPSARSSSGNVWSSVLPAVLALIPLLLVADRRFFGWGVGIVARRALKREVPPEYFLGPRAAVTYQLAFLVPRIINGAGFIAVAASFIDLPPGSMVPLAAAYVLAGAIGILAVFVPSGLGVRESVIVVLASRYIPVEQAIVLSLAARLLSTMGDGVIALIYAALKFSDRRGVRS